MNRGSKPNPSNIVELRNNPGKKPQAILDHEPVTIALTEPPEPPRKLNREAKKEWDRVIPFCIRNRIIGVEALGLLCTYCYLHSQEVKCEKAGELLPAAYLAQYRMLAEIFGFTPAGRARIKVGNAEKTDETERFFS